MDLSLSLPTPADNPGIWCRWAWLVGRRGSAADEARHLLIDTVRDASCEQEVRQTALGAYWMVSTVDDAIKLQQQLIAGGETELARFGLEHPRWWKDEQWLNALEHWFGYDAEMDGTITRLWSWQDRAMQFVRIPTEIFQRTGFSGSPSVDWQEALHTGVVQNVRDPVTPFESFWRGHVRDWVRHWLRWEESVRLYLWRLDEESALTAWTQSAPYPSSRPEIGEIQLMQIDKPRPLSETLYLTILGLGYVLNRHETMESAARWDAIWSSWSSSLNYSTFEILSNVQTTNWHIAGMTGMLRDR